MRLLYRNELEPHISQSFEEIKNFAKSLIDSDNAINWQKVNEFSYMLRRNNKHNEAVEVSRMMYEKDTTADKLNLYFVAVVDQGSNAEIQKLHTIVDEFVQQHGNNYQKHLFATWLKAANRIQDDNMFNYVFAKVPSDEKTENSYIISQYYVFLNRHSLYREVCQHYEKELAGKPNVQQFEYVKKYYETARCKLGYSSWESTDTHLPHEKKEENSSEEEQTAKGKRVFLVYGGQPSELSMIKSYLKSIHIEFIDLVEQVSGTTILEKFESFASESRFAIVLVTPADTIERKTADGKPIYYPRQNVILELGYFWAALKKENVAVLVQDKGYELKKDFLIPSDLDGLEYIATSKDWISPLFQRLKQSGFAVG